MGDRSVGSAPTGFRTVVITGGNSGLGFACAKAILEASHGAPWHVVLACRDEGRARSADSRLECRAASISSKCALISLRSPIFPLISSLALASSAVRSATR